MLPRVSDVEAASNNNIASRWTRLEFVALVGITLLAAIVRIVHLADPGEVIFDETYYAKDACSYVESSADLCGVQDEQTAVHPPLAKWMIATGIAAFGYDSFGWRIAAVVAGTVSVALLFLIGRKLFRSVLAASIGAGLLAFDFLHFVQSRVAMLDIFVLLFGLVAVLAVVMDRDRLLQSDPEGARPGRPWRYLAGAAAGAATTSKWSGVTFLLVVAALTLAWEFGARRRRDGNVGRAIWDMVRREGPSFAAAFVLVPVAVYLVSYVGRLDGTVFALPWTDGSWWHNLWERHRYMLDFHSKLTATHSYQSPPWTWVLLKRPVSYFFCSGESCNPPVAGNGYQEIFATGNPFVWWPALLALVGLAIAWVRRHDFARPEGTILAGFVLTYGFWLFPLSKIAELVLDDVPESERAAVFIFYLLPTVPFMCLALGYVVTKIGRSWEARAATALFVAGVIATFAFYYPLLTKRTLPEPQWRSRIWIFDNCDKPPAEKVTTTVTVTENGEAKVTTSESDPSGSIPPPGWCWI